MEEYRYWRACFARGLIGSQSGFWWHKAMTSHKIGLFKKGGQIGAVGKILAVLLLLGMVADLPDSVQGAAVDHVSTLLEFRNIYCDLPDWVNTSNPCVGNWTGITCSAVAGDLEITEINLRNRSCYGTIPRSLQNIRTLTSLRLEYNNFTDNFPGFLHMLPELRYLDLTNNTISGSLPREIANFTSLEILNVSNNRLNGVLPEEFVMLKKLRNIAVPERGSVGMEELFPELGEEAGVAITNDILGEAVVSGDMVEEENGNVFGMELDVGHGGIDFLRGFVVGAAEEGIGNAVALAKGVTNGKEDGENLAEMIKVGLEGGAKNKDVVEVDHDTNFEEVAKDVVHGGLECGGGVSETERHYEKLVVPEAGAEGGLVGVLLADADLVEATAEVDLGEVFGSTEAIKKFGYPGKQILVLDRDPVQGAVVRAHAEFRGAILLDEETAGTEGGGARLNESFFKEFIELALHFFGLGDGELVWGAARGGVAGLEIDGVGNTLVGRAEVRKAIMVEKAGKEIGERQLGLMGEGCGEVGEAYPLAGDEDVVGNESRRDVEAEGANVMDESLGGAGLAEVAKLIDVVINGLLRTEGGDEKVGPLKEGDAGKVVGSAVVGFEEKEDVLVGEAGERRDIGGAEGTRNVPVARDNASEVVEVAVVGRGVVAGNTLVSGGVLGGLPANLHTMESLLEFNVSRNQFGGELTAKIGLLPKIEILDISRNYFRGFLPEEIGNLTTLKYLDLNTNGFNGPLPHSIGKLIQLETLGIRANGFGEDIPKELANLKNLTRLFLRYNQFGGLIPSELGDLTGLVELFLNDNKLTGGIPETFEHLTNLKSFHVGGNKLSGRIPSFLGKFKDLKLLNLSNNSFSGRIPWTLTDITYPKGELKTILLYWNDLSGEVPEGFQNINMSGDGNFTITDNPRLCGNGTMYGVSVYKAGLKPCVPEHVSTVMIVVIVLSALVVIFCSVAIVLLYRRKQQLARAKWEAMVCQQDGQEHDEENAPSEVPTFKPCGVNYSVAEIEKATSNFAILLGRGGYGPVYKAVLPDGVEAAVKIQQKHTKQGDQEFITENELLGRLHHKKLVNLLGYCTNDVVRMLVYEFKSNGSLFSHLHGEKAHPEKITWPMRLKIALDVAEGLQYLHHGADPPVIHRDIKSGNILLDVHFNAYIADFGISKEGPTDLGNNMTVGVTSVVKGTPGYLDPEYFYSRKLTRKSDVYSFGVLLMELLTGTNPCTSGVSLSEIARSLDQSMKIADLIDPSLCGDYNGHEAWTMAQVAAKCVHRDVDKRPRMKAVLAMLENQIPVPIGDTNTEEFTGECSAVKLLPGQCGSDANGRSFGSSSPRNLKTDIKFATASEGTDEEKVITIVEESLTNFYPR
ncbi:hypothetical protein CBR_g573 [Chara braunii]|uniref:Protein kinase domain-containing protein n=1 Tax=Chara braunii TaxID=69332 RepID=A0A388KBK1_CHABU|nr:hypothetical protein CBR_g573 [Chara braunii]|eukprot:GBG67438.1 hypothetical protein CBR_g573 [Chara braunii]